MTPRGHGTIVSVARRARISEISRRPCASAPGGCLAGGHGAGTERGGCDHRDHDDGSRPGLVPDRARAHGRALRLARRSATGHVARRALIRSSRLALRDPPRRPRAGRGELARRLSGAQDWKGVVSSAPLVTSTLLRSPASWVCPPGWAAEAPPGSGGASARLVGFRSRNQNDVMARNSAESQGSRAARPSPAASSGRRGSSASRRRARRGRPAVAGRG